MGRQGPFSRVRRMRQNDITEWLTWRDSPQRTGFPFAKVVLHATFKWLAKQQPGLEHRSRHNSYVRKFLVSILGPIASTKSANETNNLSSPLETSGRKGSRENMREQWITRYHDMSAGDQGPHQALRPRGKKRFEMFEISRCK